MTFRVVSVRGIPISIHPSWLVVYALLTWMLAVGYFPQALPDQPALAYWVHGLVAALLLFVSVLLHELSHSFVALAHGMSVRGITLHVFGGVSELGEEPPSARAEFVIAIVGPLTSLGLAGVLWAVGRAGFVPAGSPEAVVDYLVVFNLAVGLFNLIPGFPLDGGRLLRAALWRWTGQLGRATETASQVGAGFALALMIVGVFRIFGGAVVAGLWMILIGMFLRGAAEASRVQVTLREALGSLAVRDVMTAQVITVRPDETIAELADRFWTHHVASFPVMGAPAADGRVRGIVSVRQVSDVPRDLWPTTAVESLMRPLTDDLVVAQGDSAYRAFEKASRNGFGRLVVLESGRLAGYLSITDLTHVLALRPGGVAAKRGADRRRLRPAA
ncbi:MAG: site-2 protease family protein [Candidatus Rokubacteria bacterium]|nr:site-2 protease family protein [Candidatus Rokubacteria bacterium]